jgi:hypothetical protein
MMGALNSSKTSVLKRATRRNVPEHAILQNTWALIDASKEVDLEINVEETEYKLLSSHQNSGQNRDTEIAKRSFHNLAHLKHLGTTGTKQSFIQEEIKRRMNSGNACYHSVQNHLSSRLV